MAEGSNLRQPHRTLVTFPESLLAEAAHASASLPGMAERQPAGGHPKPPNSPIARTSGVPAAAVWRNCEQRPPATEGAGHRTLLEADFSGPEESPETEM